MTSLDPNRGLLNFSCNWLNPAKPAKSGKRLSCPSTYRIGKSPHSPPAPLFSWVRSPLAVGPPCPLLPVRRQPHMPPLSCSLCCFLGAVARRSSGPTPRLRWNLSGSRKLLKQLASGGGGARKLPPTYTSSSPWLWTPPARGSTTACNCWLRRRLRFHQIPFASSTHPRRPATRGPRSWRRSSSTSGTGCAGEGGDGGARGGGGRPRWDKAGSAERGWPDLGR